MLDFRGVAETPKSITVTRPRERSGPLGFANGPRYSQRLRYSSRERFITRSNGFFPLAGDGAMTRVRVDDRRDYRSAIDLRTSSLGPTFFYPKTAFFKTGSPRETVRTTRVCCTESPADTNRPVRTRVID